MPYNFAPLKEKINNTHEWLVKEYGGLRTGRATPALLDRVIVEVYGSKLPLQQVASIMPEDARTLRIAPWDLSQAKHIEKALTAANLGISVGADEKGVRVFFPELTSERRTALIDSARDRLEDARITLRSVRDDVWSDIQKEERDGAMSEDDKFRYKEEMQKLIDEGNRSLQDLFEKKEKEIAS